MQGTVQRGMLSSEKSGVLSLDPRAYSKQHVRTVDVEHQWQPALVEVQHARHP